MLAAEPPLVRMPAASFGYPIHSLNQSSPVISTWLGPAPSFHEPPYRLQALAMKSPSAAGQVPKPGTKARYPGWSYRAVSGRMSDVSRAMISSKGSPRRCSISSRVALRSTGSRSGSSSRAISMSTTWCAISRIVSDSIASGLSPAPFAMPHTIRNVTLPLWGRAGWGLAGFLQRDRRQPHPIARRVALREQPLDRGRGQGPREEIALAGNTPEGLQGGKLLGPLDGVRHRHHVPRID